MGKESGKKKVKIKVDNKLRGAYGETDLSTNTIRINKKRHKASGYKRITPNKDGTENMAATLKHELLHVEHPNKSETAIRKMEKKAVSRMSPQRKKELLSLIRK